MNFGFGKYRGIIVSIALFLLLDASVLTLNFYISYEISEDAVGVNIAGRQRMLSQRMMKSLLDFQLAEDADSRRQALAELQRTTELFDATLQAFIHGGQIAGADGSPVALQAANSPLAAEALSKALAIWQPFNGILSPLLAVDADDSLGEIAGLVPAAVAYGRRHNVRLLTLMNDLTVELENIADSKAKRLRLIQTVGISLAIINFLIIMFHFLRQLKTSDEKIALAREETVEILETVNEGLFLLDRDQVIGGQYSAAMHSIFGHRDLAGKHFDSLLDGIVSDKQSHTASSFINLLFDPRKKQKLIGDLNPLRQLEVHIPQADGSFANKHLSFDFSRVEKGGQIVHILVTVQDISAQVQLARELESAKSQGEEQLELLSTVIQSDGALLQEFLHNSFRSFEKINHQLKQSARSREQYLDKINQIAALIHSYKGEAAALNLRRFASQAHDFEDLLAALRERPQLSGQDFLGLAVHLNALISQTETIAGVASKLAELNVIASPVTVAGNSADRSAHFRQLVAQLAEGQGKQVELLCSGFDEVQLDSELASSINAIAVQLLRNAVSHGIESPEARRLVEKTGCGEVDIRLLRRRDGSLRISVEDDGAGLDRQAIVQRAIAVGLLDDAAAEGLDSKAMLNLIFHPGLSTRETVDEDAGRGQGMYAVRQAVRELGGRISVRSRSGVGTRFQITIPQLAAERVSSAA